MIIFLIPPSILTGENIHIGKMKRLKSWIEAALMRRQRAYWSQKQIS
jgi:hypothetical protein